MKKKIIKIVSLILLQTFVFSGLSFGSIDSLEPTNQLIVKPANLSIDTIGLPKDIGSVKSKHQGSNGKLVVHIQDAHCNYEAQGNISKILEILSKDYNINTISVEGADGYIDTSWFKAFPDAEIRKEVADYFMKKGEITGAEFLSITSDYPIKLFGAENRDLYIKNLNAFTSTYPHKEKIEKYLLGVKSILGRFKGYIYTKNLKDFDTKIEEYKDKEITLSDYAKILSLKLKRYSINLKEYPNFSKLIYTLVYEDKIDFDTVDGERSALIDKLSKELAKDKLEELVVRSFSFKTGKLGPDEYYGYLRDITKTHNIDLTKDYPNLSNYVIYTKLYARIENENLFNEIEDIKNIVKEKLFENDDQRNLSACWDNVNILLGLIDIKLSNREFAYYRANRDKFNPEFFTDFVRSKVSRYNLAYDVEEPSEFIKENLPKLEDFYEIATKRDRTLVDNTLKTMKSEKTDVAVLISGGFHTDGITELLKKKGTSYVVVCPNITKDVESPYIQVLTNQKTPFEELLVESAAPRKDDSLLAPYVISRLALDAEAVRKLARGVDRIEGGESIEDRLRRIKGEWVRKYVSIYLAKIRESGIENADNVLQDAFIHAFTQRAREVSLPQRALNGMDEMIRKQFQSVLTSPGSGAIRIEHIDMPLERHERNAVDKTIALTIRRNGVVRRETNNATGGEFVVLNDRICKSAATRYSAPQDVRCHPGTRRSRYSYDRSKPETYVKNVKRYYYIKQSVFDKLTPEEKDTVARHEETHIQIAMGLIIVPRGKTEESFINHTPGCDIRPIMARLGHVRHMESLLLEDAEYGKSVRDYIIEKNKEISGEGATERKKKLQEELDKFIKNIYEIRANIDRTKRVLAETPYEGYDIIIICSINKEEARYRKEQAERIFAGKNTKIISIDFSGESGQIFCHIGALERAYREGLKEGIDLKAIMKDNKKKIAVFHAAGLASRASPFPQSLSNVRAEQDILGVYRDAQNNAINGTLLPLVMLNSLDFARTNDKRRVDTFWVSQLAFGTIDHGSIKRVNAPFDKFFVPINWDLPKQELLALLWQFGKLGMDGNGFINMFYPNQKAGGVIKRNGDFIIENDKDQKFYDTLKGVPSSGLDFGSFSMNNTMTLAVWEYYLNKKDDDGVSIIDKYIETGEFNQKWKRDLDPHFTRPLTILLQAIVDDPGILEGIDAPATFRRYEADANENSNPETIELKERVFADAVEVIRSRLGSMTRIKLDEVEQHRGMTQRDEELPHVTEVIEFFLLNRDNLDIFNDLMRTIGTISLGENTEWWTYRGARDVMNKKLLALADLMHNIIKIDLHGKLAPSREPTINERVLAEDIRRRGGITDANICNFWIGEKHIVLSREDVINGWEGDGVKIHNAIVQNCVLLPGSDIENSVVTHSQGKIKAKKSYITRSTATISADTSFVHNVIDAKPVKAKKEIVCDVFRPQISDNRFYKGQTRLRAPISYNPKPNDTTAAMKMSDRVRFGHNKYAFGEKNILDHTVGIRGMKCDKDKNDALERDVRQRVLTSLGITIIKGDNIFGLISKMFDKATTASDSDSPGKHPTGERILTDDEIPIFDTILRNFFTRERLNSGKTKVIEFSRAREGFAFVRHEGLLDALGAAGLPFNVHPGRGGNGLLQAHLDALFYDNLNEEELLTLANHELAHLDIANGFDGQNNQTYQTYIQALRQELRRNPALDQDQFQEDFVNSLQGCNTRKIQEKFVRLLKEHGPDKIQITVNKMTRNKRYEHCVENFPKGPFGTSGVRTIMEFLNDIQCYAIMQGLISFFTEMGESEPGSTIAFTTDRRPTSPELLRAIMVATEAMERVPFYAKEMPTPAITYYGLYNESGPMQTVTGTASHVQFDKDTTIDKILHKLLGFGRWHGFKPTLRRHEVLKEHERRILTHVRELMEIEYRLRAEDSMFDENGKFKNSKDLNALQRKLLRDTDRIMKETNTEAEEMYFNRYIDAFGRGILDGIDVGYWQHTSVGRKLLPRILRALGARVHSIGRKERWDWAVDTEDIKPAVQDVARKLTSTLRRKVQEKGGKLLGLSTSDGDSDRPGMFDENGVFNYGDKLSYLTCEYIQKYNPDKEMHVVVTASTNEAVIKRFEDKKMHVHKVRVGSPYVAKQMTDTFESIKKEHPDAIVVGFERNGGFLTGTDIQLGNGILKALPTRDAMLSLICAFHLAKEEGRTISELFYNRFRGKYSSFSWSGLIDNKLARSDFEALARVSYTDEQVELAIQMANEYTAPLGQAMIRSFSPRDFNIGEVIFNENGSVSYTFMGQKEENEADAELTKHMQSVREKLKSYFTDERTFGQITRINFLDGLRMYFKTKDSKVEVFHMRPSGNAPQLRDYTEAGTMERTLELDEWRLIIYPEIIRDFVAEKKKLTETTKFVPKSIREIMQVLGKKQYGEEETYSRTFGKNGEHNLRESMELLEDALILHSDRRYDWGNGKTEEVKREITYRPADQKVVVKETVNGKVTIHVTVTGEKAYIDIGKALDRNVPMYMKDTPVGIPVPVGLVERGQTFSVMDDDLIEALKDKGVHFLHLFDAMPTSIIAAEPLLWQEIFNFENTEIKPIGLSSAASPTLEPTGEPLTDEEIDRLISDHRKSSPGAYAVSPTGEQKTQSRLREISVERAPSKPLLLEAEKDMPPISDAQAPGLELLGVEANGVFERFNIVRAMPSDNLVAQREHTLFVKEGKVKLVGENAEEIAVLEKGDERPMPAHTGNYIIKVLEGPAEIYMQYSPLQEERAIYATPSILEKHLGALKGLKVALIADDRMYSNGGIQEAEARWRALGAEVQIVDYSGAKGLSDQTERQRILKRINENAIPFILATAKNLRAISIGESGKFRKLCLRAKKMPLPELSDMELRGKGWFFAREIEAMAMIAAATTVDDIKEQTSIALDLQSLWSQFTDRSVSLNDLMLMMPFDQMMSEEEMMDPDALVSNIVKLITKLLIKLPAKPFNAADDMHKRREILWSV